MAGVNDKRQWHPPYFISVAVKNAMTSARTASVACGLWPTCAPIGDAGIGLDRVELSGLRIEQRAVGALLQRQLRVLCAFGTANSGGVVGLSKPCWLSAYSVIAMSAPAAFRRGTRSRQAAGLT